MPLFYLKLFYVTRLRIIISARYWLYRSSRSQSRCTAQLTSARAPSMLHRLTFVFVPAELASLDLLIAGSHAVYNSCQRTDSKARVAACELGSPIGHTTLVARGAVGGVSLSTLDECTFLGVYWRVFGSSSILSIKIDCSFGGLVLFMAISSSFHFPTPGKGAVKLTHCMCRTLVKSVCVILNTCEILDSPVAGKIRLVIDIDNNASRSLLCEWCPLTISHNSCDQIPNTRPTDKMWSADIACTYIHTRPEIRQQRGTCRRVPHFLPPPTPHPTPTPVGAVCCDLPLSPPVIIPTSQFPPYSCAR
ncbi:hypothetical protein J6590_044249 [Homalodisca vitripennis]|nr:hypothetical protein J6590_044249 [Homalodisca vitripennis]